MLKNDALNSSVADSSTPPTSINDAGSPSSAIGEKDSKDALGSGRARRSRRSLVNYNESVLAGTRKTPVRRKYLTVPTKHDSEETVVLGVREEVQQLVEDGIQVLNLDWTVDALPGDDLRLPAGARKSKSRLDLGKDTIAVASSVVQKTASVLGKRSRYAMGAGLSKLQELGGRKSLRPRTEASSETNNPELTPSKRVKLAKAAAREDASAEQGIVRKPVAKPLSKKWLSQGLYVGQDPDFDPRLTNAKNKQKRANAGSNTPKQRKILPMPMFAGKRIVENGRNFRLPFDIFSPLPPGQPKPEEWRKTQKSEWSGK